jgi:hypothetical protein
MGQKSLSSLHRIDSSMIWNSSLYNANYKWLSYNLWFSYLQFYKVIFFFNAIKSKYCTNVTFYNNKSFIKKNKKYFTVCEEYIRFSYYIELYCVEFYDYLFLINIFFLTNLKFFKDVKSRFNVKKKKFNDIFH